MNSNERGDTQRKIIAELGVAPHFDAAQEIDRRVAFLAGYLARSGLKTLVLGISGGVDSSLAGRLCQLAAERERKAGRDATFIAMRLPYGVQHDEADAQRALSFIRADRTLTVDIKPASDAMLKSLRDGELAFDHEAQEDFLLGNIKARQRMIAQYAVAGRTSGLVVGTDHAAEAVMGFFTKHGDGACDVTPLAGLNKRRVRALAMALGAVREIADKIPTADLETLTPQRPDEDSYGISYNDIDDFLEGQTVSDAVYATVLKFYQGTVHKRSGPLAP